MPLLATGPVPIVCVSGPPRERGRQHGELMRNSVGLGVERYMERFAHFGGLTFLLDALVREAVLREP
jgi:hypothetical protein